MRELAYYEAKFEALDEIMAADQRVHLINGTFLSLSPHRHMFQNLQKKYRDRMVSPPISELGFCGLATGAAMAGLRPIVDLSTGSFIYEAWPQVANEAANAYSMSGGQTRVPVVFHLFHGLRGGGAAQHSGSPQAMLWNCPGLEIAIPSSPRDVKGLLKTAVASDNPTIFVDHTKLLDTRGEVPENDKPIPFGVADVKRKGSDVTLIATSYTVQVCLKAAWDLAKERIDVEVVDPRTLVPFDLATVLSSVEKTGRVVIADETHNSCGVGAEIAARIAESGFDKLKTAIRRVSTLDVPVPYSPPLEEYIGPTPARITAAIRAALV
jgi:pyruvate/2-oxoglutarate/acetoin dehydrogenase E1 component